MRPTPNESANGVRTLLKEIAPEIKTVEGLRHFRRLMATLRDIRWNETAFDILAENATLLDAIALMRRESTLGDDLRAKAEAAEADQQVPKSFAEANDRNARLRGLLNEMLEAAAKTDLRGSAAVRRTITERLLALQR